MRKQRQYKTLDATKPMTPPKKAFTRKELRAKTPGQQTYIDAIDNCQIVICDGVSGSGKTAIAIGLACRYLLANKVEKIVLTRPLVTGGAEEFGLLPGGILDKIDPFMRPLYEELNKYYSYSELAELKNSKRLEIIPFAYMRGLNFHNSFVIADECQNATLTQLKMLLTRIGNNSKLVITGDCDQSDLNNNRHDFEYCLDNLYDIPEIAIIELIESDIVRNPLIGTILKRLNKNDRI